MDRHMKLYKEHSRLLNSRGELQQKYRAKKRSDMYFDIRNISLDDCDILEGERISATSTPDVKSKANKENLGIVEIQERKEANVGEIPCSSKAARQSLAKAAVEKHISRIAKAANKDTSAKLTKQEAYLRRFVEWKQKKKIEETQKTNRKSPIPWNSNMQKKPTEINDNTVQRQQEEAAADLHITVLSSFAPENHQFKPPEGLKDPTKNHPVLISLKEKRQSLYTLVPTPPKKNVMSCIEKKKPVTRRPLMRSTNPVCKTTAPSTNLDNAAGITGTIPKSLPNIMNKKTPAPVAVASSTIFGNVGKKALFASASKKVVPPASLQNRNVIKKPEDRAAAALKGKMNPSKAPSVTREKPAITKVNKTPAANPEVLTSKAKTFKAPQPAARSSASTKTNNPSGGAVAKAQKLLIQKKAKDSEDSTKQKTKKLSTQMKAKNVNVKTTKVGNLNKKMLLAKKDVEENLFELHTPTLLDGGNPFLPLCTSTQSKTLSLSPTKSSNEKLIEPIVQASEQSDKNTFWKTARHDLSEKFEGNLELAEKLVCNKENEEDRRKSFKPKMNFMRKFESSDVENTICDSLNETPKTSADIERPANYMSPFVTCSRGKVSLREEKKKRDSVYLQGETPPTPIQDKNANGISCQTPVEVRRSLEAVKYFRKQLSDEIDRLHGLCDKWDLYRKENQEQLLESGGDDMINVTVGQTRLLTSKKFMQFKGLIDRCEAGASGVNALPDDGSEATKPITPVDLEGFWSMLGLQVENVEKRFENLENWKSNDWKDPQEAREATKPSVKVKKNLTKKLKPSTKAKASSGLKDFLKKLQNDKKNLKKDNLANKENGIEILGKENNSSGCTPRRSRLSQINQSEQGTPSGRISFIVRDRKSFSNSPTVLTMNSPLLSRRSSRKSLKTLRESMPSPQLKNLKINETQDLLKTALMGAAATTSTNCSPPRTVTRKSILKTPGTAKDKTKNVVFNNKLEVRKFKFTVDYPTSSEEDEEETKATNQQGQACATQSETLTQEERDNMDSENKETPRTYRLRNRKVYLRPSFEIVIPK